MVRLKKYKNQFLKEARKDIYLPKCQMQLSIMYGIIMKIRPQFVIFFCWLSNWLIVRPDVVKTWFNINKREAYVFNQTKLWKQKKIAILIICYLNILFKTSRHR